MENQERKNESLVNVVFELRETKNGKQVIDFVLEGKHYQGWVEEREEQGQNGPWTKRFGYWKICNWDNCRKCHPQDEFLI